MRLKFVVLFFILLFAGSVDAQNFRFPITVSDGVSSAILTLGVDPDGTAEYDSLLDLILPGAPPTGAFDARLTTPTEAYSTDIRGNSISQNTFVMRYRASSENGPIVLTWDPACLPLWGTFTIVDDITGELYSPLDMAETNTLDVSSGSGLINEKLRILVTPIEPAAALAYSSTEFTENDADDGSIDNTTPVLITLTDDVFTGTNGDDFVTGGKLVVSNLPTGLTAVAQRTSDTVVQVTLTGNATSHADADDVSNLTFAFQDTAFSCILSADVTNSTKSDLTIDFIEGGTDVPPTVTTQAATDITQTTATGNGDLTDLGVPDATERGICWGTTTDPDTSVSHSHLAATGTVATGAFTVAITGLTAGETYHVRAYAVNADTTVYGADSTFTTTAATPPTVATGTVTAITTTTATSNDTLTAIGDPNATERGICWGTAANPDTSGSHLAAAGTVATGTFTVDITGLTAGTTYHVRAYAVNADTTVYGADSTFTTLALPTVTTGAATDITDTTATGNGNVTDLGNPNATERGICWGTAANPNISGSHLAATGTVVTGTFTAAITGLTAGETYHVRAYAVNADTTVYGADVTFTTLELPTVTTQAVTAITATTATGNGNVTDLGNPNATERGICWGTAANPNISGSHLAATGTVVTGTFTAAITGLTAGETYHVRAYAVNADTTVYGADVTFTTLELPTVTTGAATAITDTTATGNGDLTDLGVPDATERGVCWGTTTNPDTSGSHLAAAGTVATGTFTVAITGLTANTLYHVRAYAVNADTTVYGADVTFTTLELPTVTTQDATDITTTTATGNGTITDLGSPDPTEHGVCWSVSSNPTTSNGHTTLGAASATGTFTTQMTGLTPGTLYYVRAYATNNAGTVYGNEVQFTTLKLPTVTTGAATAITDTTATGNGNVTDLGNPNATERGICWGTTADPDTSVSHSHLAATGTVATGAFTVAITGLTDSTTYHVRAYAVNADTTVYGADVTFTTLALPTVTTGAATDITGTTATGHGDITSLGVPNPTQHGVCWNTTGTPEITDDCTTEGTVDATGAFTSNITGLAVGGTYHVRAYATNDAGTAYGADSTFTTLNGISLPINAWNWICPSNNFANTSMATIWTGHDYDVVQWVGGFFMPPYIMPSGNWDYTTMYMVHSSFGQSQLLPTTGSAIDPTTPIPLTTGWNWIPYYGASSMSANVALADISGNLIYAEGFGSGLYIPGVINTLTMSPGNGYRVYVSAIDTLTYSSSRGTIADQEEDEIRATEHFTFHESNYYYPVLFLDHSIEELELTEGDEVGIFAQRDGELFCIGASVWQDRLPFSVVGWTDDSITDIKDGYDSGESIILKVWRHESGLEEDMELFFENNAAVYESDLYSIATLDADLLSIDDEVASYSLQLDQNHPNPFNPSTTIHYEIPVAGHVTLQIYNINGQLIRTLTDESHVAGEHNVTWDAKNNQGEAVSSGIYFYQLEAMGTTQSKRMALLR